MKLLDKQELSLEIKKSGAAQKPESDNGASKALPCGCRFEDTESVFSDLPVPIPELGIVLIIRQCAKCKTNIQSARVEMPEKNDPSIIIPGLS